MRILEGIGQRLTPLTVLSRRMTTRSHWLNVMLNEGGTAEVRDFRPLRTKVFFILVTCLYDLSDGTHSKVKV